MRAVVQDRYGGPDRFRLVDLPRPLVGKDEVLVQVRAAGVDRGTWHLMTGLPLAIRLGFGLRGPRQPVPGLDLAGTVLAVGDQVSRFEVGDEVFGIGKGALAEVATALESKLTHKPSGLTFEEAAAVSVSGLTALQGVCDAGGLEAGQRVLILGGSGAVGHYAVQIAVATGAHVTAACSAAKADWVRALGAHVVLDYAADDLGSGYDLVLDTAGRRPLSVLRRLLVGRGTAVLVGGEGGGRWLGGFDRQLRASMVSAFVPQRLVPLLSRERYEDLNRLVALVEAGSLRPVIDSTHPLEHAADAVRRMASGDARGKVVVTMEPAVG